MPIFIYHGENDNHIKNQNFYNSNKIKYVVGGASRQESINNALNAKKIKYFLNLLKIRRKGLCNIGCLYAGAGVWMPAPWSIVDDVEDYGRYHRTICR